MGRRLLFKVSDLMSPIEQTPTVKMDAKVSEVLNAITEGKMGALLVIDDEEKLLGLITDHDIRMRLQKDESFFNTKIEIAFSQLK